jgi:hypothetical protein
MRRATPDPHGELRCKLEYEPLPDLGHEWGPLSICPSEPETRAISGPPSSSQPHRVPALLRQGPLVPLLPHSCAPAAIPALATLLPPAARPAWHTMPQANVVWGRPGVTGRTPSLPQRGSQAAWGLGWTQRTDLSASCTTVHPACSGHASCHSLSTERDPAQLIPQTHDTFLIAAMCCTSSVSSSCCFRAADNCTGLIVSGSWQL